MELLKYREETYEMSMDKRLKGQIEKGKGDNQPVRKL
jgi:hypothetical protein